MRELALFAGAGGGILGGHLLGWRCVCAVEFNAYAASVLVARQNDGSLAPFPIWDDVSTFDGRPWRGAVDVVSGGFPCQDISVAGSGAGLDGERSGLWREMARIIREVRPRFAFVENSPALTIRGIDVVLRDLAEMGYDARWGVHSAADVGAPHRRERIWIIAADTLCDRLGISSESLAVKERQESSDSWRHGASQPVADVDEVRPQRAKHERREVSERTQPGYHGSEIDGGGSWWSPEPDVVRVVHGVANRVDRIAALGNGQVPRVAEFAWQTITEESK